MKDGLLFRISVRVVPLVLGLIAKLLFATCRVTVNGADAFNRLVNSGRPVVVSFWHYSFLGLFPVLGKHKGVVMVSSSRDGEYIASMARQFGLGTVRGSRNRRGVGALKELIRAVRDGRNAGIVADGSQGPARIAQPGAILLASRADAPLVPVVWSASKYFTIRSWDRTAFPKPFSRVEVVFGEPLEIPAGLKADGVEEYRLLLEQRLNTLYADAWEVQGLECH